MNQKLTITQLPKPIQNLYQKSIETNHEFWIFGETLTDLYYTDKEPLHYQLATDYSKEQFCQDFQLTVNKINNKNLLVLYFFENQFYILKNDFLPDNLVENRFYIELTFFEENFLSTISDFILPIDQFAYNFDQYFNQERVSEYFDQKKLIITDSEKETLSQNLFYLFKLIRYSVKYELEPDDIISPKQVEDFKFTFENRPFWKSEIIKLLELPKPSTCFELLREWGILSIVFSELLEGYLVYQNEFHRYDVYYHSLSACDAANAHEPLIRISALFHDIGKPRSKRQVTKESEEDSKNVFYDHENIGARMAYQILKKFGFTKATRAKISKLIRFHMFHYTNEWTDRAVRRLIGKVNTDLENLFKLRLADRIGSGKKTKESKAIINLEKRIKQIEEEDSRTTVKDLQINGNDLMTLFNLSPGPIVGKVLSHLLDIIIENPEDNEYELLVEKAKSFLEKLDSTT